MYNRGKTALIFLKKPEAIIADVTQGLLIDAHLRNKTAK